mgnify:CR=1 FL=1
MKDHLIDELDADCLLPLTFGSNPKHIDVFSATHHVVEVETEEDRSTFDQKMAKGFVELWGIQSTEANKLQKKRSTKI